MKKIAILLVRFYQLGISPFVGDCCRFAPTCSDFCLEALKKYPLSKALWLSLKRIARCHPFHKGGYDPLP